MSGFNQPNSVVKIDFFKIKEQSYVNTSYSSQHYTKLF